MPFEGVAPLSIWIPIALQVLSILLFVARSVVMKKLVTEKNFFPPVYTFLYSFIMNGLLCIAATVEFAANGVNLSDMHEGFWGGVAQSVAISMMQYGMTKGKGGPAIALSNFSMILQTAGSAVFLGQDPTVM